MVILFPWLTTQLSSVAIDNSRYTHRYISKHFSSYIATFEYCKLFLLS